MDKPSGPAAASEDLSLIGHLAELRRRLIKSLLAVTAGCIVTWNFAEGLLGFLMKPVLDVLPPGQGLIYTGLQDGFVITVKTSLWAGVLVSAPFWMYQLWAFVAPALYAREKKQVGRLTALATVLLLAGAAFAYFLAFPLAFNFFIKFSSPAMHPLLALDRYCSLAMGIILGFALGFQLPLGLMFLGRLGVLDAAFLRRHRRYAIVLAFIVGAVLTPPEVISQILLASALLVLYELSIFLLARSETGGQDPDGPPPVGTPPENG